MTGDTVSDRASKEGQDIERHPGRRDRPTRKGESERLRINHARTTASIWVPMPTKVVEVQTKEKLRYRKTERG